MSLKLIMAESNQKIALTIAGSDPSGGAGFQADLKTFHAMGVYGVSVPAVLTAQSTRGVHSVHELSGEFLAEQLDVLLSDICPDAVKTGMLYRIDNISLVSKKLSQYRTGHLVIDPVAVSSTGVQLIEDKGLDVLKNELFPLARVITPNIYEAGLFTGMEISCEEEMKEAAHRLKELGPESVIITGGHLQERAGDILYDNSEFLLLENDSLEGDFHGTGCVFSAALAAALALGQPIKEAFESAKSFTFVAMKKAIDLGTGMKVLNIS